MAKRLISGAVGIVFLVGVIIAGSYFHIVIDIFVVLVCAFSVGEFAHATDTLKKLDLSIPSILFALAFPILYIFDLGLLVWYLYSAVMLTATIINHKKITFMDFAYIYSMTLIITVSLNTILIMKTGDTDHTIFYFVVALSLPWLADAGAYFTGTFFGKHKLCPNISPKKTVEGAIGGTVVCVLVTCFVGFIFSQWVYTGVKVNYLNLAAAALIGSVLSILGDLSFSLVKRTFDIKDYGNLIPGHGGVLDRFDSVVFVSPFLMIFFKYLPVLNF